MTCANGGHWRAPHYVTTSTSRHRMRRTVLAFALTTLATGTATPALAQPALRPLARPDSSDPAWILTQRLDLERYKATIKGLTQFGDRRQGTARNAAAVDWIEAQLKSYGCTNTQRVTYDFQPPPPRTGGPGGPGGAGGPRPMFGAGGSRPRGNMV